MVSHCGSDLNFPKDAEYLFCIPPGYPFIFLGDWFQDPQQILKSECTSPSRSSVSKGAYQQKIFYPWLTESAEPTGMKGQLYLSPLLFNYLFSYCWVKTVLYIFRVFISFCGLSFHFLDSVLWSLNVHNFDEITSIFVTVFSGGIFQKWKLLSCIWVLETPWTI